MPKNEIDYSNTIIYKITCKNQAITDVYVGHTTNFVQRKHAHKQSCINSKSVNHKCKLYEVIRANGGWENWQMEIINFFNCADHYAARKKEQEYFIELKATLNSIEPFPKPKVVVETENKIIKVKPNMYCTTCNIHCNNLKSFDSHNKSNKHIKLLKINQENEKTPKNAKSFHCEKCDFKCSKQCDWVRHIGRAKHIRIQNDIINTSKNSTTNICSNCGKIYKYYSGLWKHLKNCVEIKEKKETIYKTENEIVTILKDNNDFKKIILDVVKNNTELQKQNQEFQKQMMELYKNGNNTVINNNNHNKTFNMQIFLNEQCKDAMNIMDFVNSMTLELSDLEDVGKLGYVEGISNIIIRKLNAMDIYKRPIHCSDAKREIMFVKDENIWEKENSTYDKLRKAIKRVTYKNSAMLVPWSQEHPQCMNNQHHLNDVYVQMMGQAMGGKESFLDSENKIMKKIAKAVLIDKNL